VRVARHRAIRRRACATRIAPFTTVRTLPETLEDDTPSFTLKGVLLTSVSTVSPAMTALTRAPGCGSFHPAEDRDVRDRAAQIEGMT
jgi:hypothetical protein